MLLLRKKTFIVEKIARGSVKRGMRRGVKEGAGPGQKEGARKLLILEARGATAYGPDCNRVEAYLRVA